jgi:hypothetical protein
LDPTNLEVGVMLVRALLVDLHFGTPLQQGLESATFFKKLELRMCQI